MNVEAGGLAENLRPRQPLSPSSFDLRGALAATAAAVVAYVWALSTGALPSLSFSIVLFAAAPICGVIALPVLMSRGRRQPDAALRWFAAGLAVCVLALILQLISYPTVAAAGGPFGTSDRGISVLYLLFHLALYGGAVAGALNMPTAGIPPFVGAGAVLTILVALDAVPLPRLLGPGDAFTPLLAGLEYGLAGLAVLSLVLWVRMARDGVEPLRGWVGVSLSLSTYEILLNAIAGQRFGAVWWSSLSLRAAAFAVLAGGCVAHLLRHLSRVESYADAELALRESELSASVTVTDRLLANARRLGNSATALEIAAALQSSAMAGGDVDWAGIACPEPTSGRLELLPSDAPLRGVVSLDRPGPYKEVLRTRRPLFLGSPGEIESRFHLEGVHGVQAIAALPLRVGGRTVGAMVATRGEARPWTALDRELLMGLADQAGPALARARVTDRQHVAAETLQRSLLPSALPEANGIRLAARYQPAVRGDRVGGDWYDAWCLSAHEVLLVVGDVVGKGLEAAATMGRLRAATRALAEADQRPGAILHRLDHMEAGQAPCMIATVLCIRLDVRARRAHIARAGHLPPVLATREGATLMITGGVGPPIGCAEEPIDEVAVDLPEGSTLILYTDGLVEDRARHIDASLGLLCDAAGRACAAGFDADGIAASVLATTLRFEPGDDVALLIVTLDPSEAG